MLPAEPDAPLIPSDIIVPEPEIYFATNTITGPPLPPAPPAPPAPAVAPVAVPAPPVFPLPPGAFTVDVYPPFEPALPAFPLHESLLVLAGVVVPELPVVPLEPPEMLTGVVASEPSINKPVIDSTRFTK